MVGSGNDHWKADVETKTGANRAHIRSVDMLFVAWDGRRNTQVAEAREPRTFDSATSTVRC